MQLKNKIVILWLEAEAKLWSVALKDAEVYQMQTIDKQKVVVFEDPVCGEIQYALEL